MTLTDGFEVEVAYGKPERQAVIALWVKPGATVADAVAQSRIVNLFPEIDTPSAKFGIFGKHAQPSTPLAPGDRVEIYRDLVVDPKVARRMRAKAETQARAAVDT